MGIALADLLHPLLLPANYRRMHNLIQFLNSRRLAAEGKFGQPGAVYAAIRFEDPGSEMPHDLFIDIFAGLHELMRDFVGLDDLRTQGRKHLAHHRLAGSDAARQTDLQHCQACSAANAGRRDPRRIFAAFTVFAISMAMVSGPTPPGTGVIAPATSATLG